MQNITMSLAEFLLSVMAVSLLEESGRNMREMSEKYTSGVCQMFVALG
jgi:hypothetical protein